MDAWLSQARDVVAGAAGTPPSELEIDDGSISVSAVGSIAGAALFGPRDLSFSITIVFGRFDGPAYDEAVAMARESAEYREVGSGDAFRDRARVYPREALSLRTLFERVDAALAAGV